MNRMSKDTIYRQEAIDAIDVKNVNKGIISALQSIIEELPPAQPERMRGKWINRSLNTLYPEWERYTCSVCGKHSNSYDFCPNCGADMRGEQNE